MTLLSKFMRGGEKIDSTFHLPYPPPINQIHWSKMVFVRFGALVPARPLAQSEKLSLKSPNH
jgi:hypothetical protein